MSPKAFPLILMVLLFLLVGASGASALTIEGTFIGGAELGTSFGGGTINQAFRAAADVWEHLIKDKFTVHFDYG